MEKKMEVEYEKNEIMDKINNFFGYTCINNVTLKIIKNKIENIEKALPKIKDLKKIDDKIKKVDNEQLKNSLKNFLKSYNERTKEVFPKYFFCLYFVFLTSGK